ncbi:putative NRPS-like enzyme [Aspergillus nomiae NRRL 13137]|uniref:Putative NRPS-like enzyme n=1 Tax=Aspergillus nomiae NRRL (strain ATCC 15546 / NRRL 13137 / CBS 260.88 / M93) TaxID=1509407 RepID=A0A0L1J9E9_ASPN3|nr:putative NRPS-like enzyme [Aspergillus nomiae NRRL 13137]KNG88357.1 putative NRPS-like enzyme [Aspergillus nomiae NRRL 13137]
MTLSTTPPSPEPPGADEYGLCVASNLGLGQLFYRQVRQSPSSIAVVDGESSITYGQLHAWAVSLAAQLSHEGFVREEAVGIVVQHGVADVVAQMAVIYAGGSCAPMDPTLRDQQICQRLERLNSRFILVDQSNRGRDLQFQQIVLEEHLPLTSKDICDDNNFPVTTDLSHRTHLIHTSGTTSEPKAVQIAARSILQVVFHAPFEPVTVDDVVAHANNSSFDVSLFDIWVPLLRGARIAVLKKMVLLDLLVLAEHIDRLGITVMATTTALLNLAASTLPTAFSKLRICFIGGEAANVSAIETVLRKGPPEMLINAYGPTECCIFCLAHRVTPKDIQMGSVSIGTPIGHTVAYIADESGRAANEGELWIGGAGVSPGYINQPEKNAKSFPTIVMPSGEAARFYRTGDIVRRRDDGQIDYVGRVDHQIKVRGFRIELEAVETSLLQTGLFAEVAAMGIQSPQEGAGSVLVAYATPKDPAHPPEISKALEILQDTLPDYMIPQLQLIQKMPLNSHAKVDRKGLKQLFCQRSTSLLKPGPKLPNTLCQDTQTTLASLWATILANPKPEYKESDDFFVLGGTSLQASLLISQIRQVFRCEVSLLALYDNSTVGALASIIDHAKGGHLKTVRDEREFWLADTKLADDLPAPMTTPVNWQRDIEGRIFITGATGFVGAFLLVDLLNMPSVHQIGCLVRAPNSAAGMQRLRLALEKYNLWEDRFTNKLLAFPGLLEDKYLGLGQARFNELASWASVVFHLGARVNYTQPYSLHRPANTLGTINVVRFACTRRNKAVHYVSSISCFGPTGFVTGTTSVGEDDSLLPHVEALPYDHGYAQSQWVADQLLRRLMDRGFPISIYRPGFITGHSQTGVCNPDDFFSRLMIACEQMKSYPMLPNQRKEFVPVDYVNSVILHIAASEHAVGRAYHIVPPARDMSIDMDDTMELLGEAVNSRIHGLPYMEWIDRLAANPPVALQPLQPMLAERVHDGMTRWELYANMPVYQTTNTDRMMANYPGGLKFPALDASLLGKYIAHLRSAC